MKTSRLVTLTLLMAVPLARAESKALQAVLDAHWAWTLKQDPLLATDLGVRDFDTTLGDQSPASSVAEEKAIAAFVSQLEKIDSSTLTDSERVNRDILLSSLRNRLGGFAFGQKHMNFTNRGGWHSGFAQLPTRVPFVTAADFQSYVARLNDYPRYNAEGMATARLALKGGYTQYCESMRGFEKSISAHILEPKDIDTSVFLKPFRRRPAGVAESTFASLKQQALQAIKDKVIPAYAAFLKFYLQEYVPRCRKLPGASSLKDGAAFYAHRIATQTTTRKTADEIHALGLAEVARILAEMDAVVAEAKFKGSRADYVKALRSEPKFAATSAEALMTANQAFMKRVDGEMPKLFGRLPRLPYTVSPIPDDIAEGNTTAYYEAGAAATGRAGVFRVNTTKLAERYLFEIPALGLHEAVPGHHHQIALQQELEVPNFRRHAVFFTAFVEGWGLYSERLGIEMGVYDTPEKNFGRLSYEMWRACRLVVDTGLHAKGWTRQQAINYMMENTALSRTNIEAEVDRYISWPGQALAYKIGELKIRELRARAEAQLGSAFDVRRFHDAVLEHGAVPLDVLETNINDFIAKNLRELSKGEGKAAGFTK
jgi:uncharacterized protein (DUF885 family)